MAEMSANPEVPHPHLLKPMNKRILWGMLAFMLVFLVVPGCCAIWYAFCPQQTTVSRIFFLCVGAVTLFVPGWVAFVCIRRRVTTGSWKISDEERMRNRAKWAVKRTPAQERRTQVIFWSSDIVMVLAGLSFFWRAFRPHHRHQDWSDILLLVFWAFVMALTLYSIYSRQIRKPRTSGPAAGSPPPDSLPS